MCRPLPASPCPPLCDAPFPRFPVPLPLGAQFLYTAVIGIDMMMYAIAEQREFEVFLSTNGNDLISRFKKEGGEDPPKALVQTHRRTLHIFPPSSFSPLV